MLSYEDQRKIFDKVNKEFEEKKEKWEQERLKELEKKGIASPNPSTYPKKYCDSPYTMENSTATFFWILSLIIGAIFKDKWVIWIVSTFIWIKFITRHK